MGFEAVETYVNNLPQIGIYTFYSYIICSKSRLISNIVCL